MNEQLIGLVIQELPTVIGSLRALFVQRNPDAPAPTNEEVLAAFDHAVADTLETDAAWIRTHPEDAPPADG